VTEKTKSCTAREGKEAQDKLNDDECMEITAKGDDEFV
jgi:hypothetical protein